MHGSTAGRNRGVAPINGSSEFETSGTAHNEIGPACVQVIPRVALEVGVCDEVVVLSELAAREGV
eukprot:3194754-Rhodomonas_salina.4